MIIEYARNILKLNANSEEFVEKNEKYDKVVMNMPDIDNNKMGGTIYRTFGNMDMGFQTLYELFSWLDSEKWNDWQSRIRYTYI